MQSATQTTLTNLVEQHVISLIRESAVVNRHSKRGGSLSAADSLEEDHGASASSSGATGGRAPKRRRLIHHDDVNMALLWRGSEKLYVSGLSPLGTDGDGSGVGQLLKSSASRTPITPAALLKSNAVPRIDLNAYLNSDNLPPPPTELGMTLHWLAVDGVMPLLRMNDVWNGFGVEGGRKELYSRDVAPLVQLDENDNNNSSSNPDSSIRIRELQHRLLSEELQLYFSKITTALSNPISPPMEVSSILNGIRTDGGIQELVPFLSRFVASGLMEKKKGGGGGGIGMARRLVGLFDAMLDNASLHLDLHLHQLFTPIGTCIVAKKLSSTTTSSSTSTIQYYDPTHYSLRYEAAASLVKACTIYSSQYTTMKPRIIKLLTQQALRIDRPLVTQYGGIVGLSLFGARAVDAFVLPVARGYWEWWEAELERCVNESSGGDEVEEGGRGKKNKLGKRDVVKEYELSMCQQALLVSRLIVVVYR